jgi:hypothetical protein
LSHYLFYTKKCNELNVGGGGGGLSFLDEGLENKGLAIGGGYKKCSKFGIYHPLPLLMTGPLLLFRHGIPWYKLIVE